MKLPRPAHDEQTAWRSPYLLVALVTVTALGVLSAVVPAQLQVFGVVAVGVPLAAASASPAAVVVVGAYAFAFAMAVSTFEGFLGSPGQIVRLTTVVAATGIGWVTARHVRSALRAAISAARERETLAAIVEQSSDAIFATRLDGTITSWNRGAELMYGYRAAQVIGSPIADVLTADDPDRMRAGLAELAAGRQIRQDEVVRTRAGGETFLVSMVASPIRDVQGNVVGATATERDITDEARARERSARSARLESLGQLAGGVAHDFNNLLAIILNYADFLAEEVHGDGARDLARIQDAADRAKSLTEQLLLFAKREPVKAEVVDLNAVVVEAGDLLSRTIGAHVQLVCRPHEGELPVCANRGRLDQILLNLVINARDAMPDGGVVTVGADRTEIGAGEAPPMPPGECVRLTVTDTGTGMTAEVRDRLFEPFFTTKPADKGTGLGLATVYGIVGEAGGHIGVESAVGEGTTFRILLPVAGAATGPLAENVAEGAPGQGELIAVVEDDEHVRDIVLRILRENGYRATALGEHSWADDDLDGVSLLVTDIVLPGRSGPALAERMRARRPGLRVLFMSGYSNDELRLQYGLGEATRILQKPFNAVELLAGVGQALETAPEAGRPGSRQGAAGPYGKPEVMQF